MQRPSPDALHADCQRIASLAREDDSIVRLAERLTDEGAPLSLPQVKRRVALMHRELGDTADAEERRAGGATARRWARRFL